MVSALVMLSLFVGAVTMAMSESMETMKEEADAKDKARRLEKGKAAALALQNAGRVRSPLFGNANKGGTEAEVEEEEEEEEVMVGGKAAREKAKMKMLLLLRVLHYGFCLGDAKSLCRRRYNGNE